MAIGTTTPLIRSELDTSYTVSKPENDIIIETENKTGLYFVSIIAQRKGQTSTSFIGINDEIQYIYSGSYGWGALQKLMVLNNEPIIFKGHANSGQINCYCKIIKIG